MDARGRASSLVDELREHMAAEGEIDASGAASGDAEGAMASLVCSLVLEQKAKLVHMSGAPIAYLVPSGQDWAHDALGDAEVVAGTFYGDGDPFLEGSADVTGYFEADDGGWSRIEKGHARACRHSGVDWRESLEEFPEVLAELQSAMDVPEYRRVAEQAAMKTLVGAM